MFSYYGSKSKIINYYPPPKHGKIIEPFAGSARYSLKYWDREVLLVDKYEIIIKTWLWLQQCSKKDILGLPDIRKLKKGFDLRTLNLTEGELYFLGFNAAISSISPRFKISDFAANQNGMATYTKRVSENLFKIKHWKIELGSYENISNQQATWFIDPPYQFGGHAYIENNINFQDLAEWSRGREGQVIVCENSKAIWLPFLQIKNSKGTRKEKQMEAIWSNEITNYDNRQIKLF